MARVSDAEILAYNPDTYVFWALKGRYILRKLPHGGWERAYQIKDGVDDAPSCFKRAMARNGCLIVNKLPCIPSLKTLERWAFDGVAKATDGCTVEPDGTCPHGRKSWLLVLGVM